MLDTCPCCASSTIIVHGNCNRCSQCLHQWRTPDSRGHKNYYQKLKNRNNSQSDRFKKKLVDRFNAIASLVDDKVNNILEVGCAEGILGKKLKNKFDISYDGVEISQDAVLAVQELDTVYSFTTDTLKGREYDLVVSFHVLEHIEDIVHELRQWHRLVSETGFLLIEVPNQAGHQLLLTDGNPEHVHQFTVQSLACLLIHSGFDVLSVTTGNFESEVYNDSIRIIAKRTMSDEQKNQLLIERFEHRLTEPFNIYGVGGDFINYILPIIGFLQVLDLLDSSPSQWGNKISGRIVKKYNEQQHGGQKILVASIRYESDIVEHLLTLGVSQEQIVTLGQIYDDTQ